MNESPRLRKAAKVRNGTIHSAYKMLNEFVFMYTHISIFCLTFKLLESKAVSNSVQCLAQLKMQIEHNFYADYIKAPGFYSLW